MDLIGVSEIEINNYIGYDVFEIVDKDSIEKNDNNIASNVYASK